MLSKLHFPEGKFSIARFLGAKAHFEGPELPVNQFLIAKKHFSSNTNIVEDF
jgi:hypothetical protein